MPLTLPDMQKRLQPHPYSSRTMLLLLLLCLFGIPTFAQKEAQTWYFGKNAGLSFSTNPPTVLTDGQINTREGVSSISDRTTGQLLFYSEGTNVWNRNHGIMPNGSGLLGDYSSTQSSVVVPNPGNPNRYYLFTTALSNGVRYSEIDMTMAGGLGDVIPATKNTLLLPGTSSSEKLIAVQHCNKQDYWVITHTIFSNAFYVYLVTTAGVQAPATYSIGYTIGGTAGWEATGYLKLSPDGSKLAHVIGPQNYGFLAQVEILSFNDKTGVIAGPVVSINNIDYPYGAEFSQSGRYLYISELWGKKILQYDITDPAVNTTRTQITSSTNLQFGALQLGPDNKIYVTAENGTDVGYPYLGVINNPDMQGAGSGYVQDAINLNGRSTLIGLPTFNATFLQKDTASVQLSGNCTGSNISFSLTNTNNTDSVKWTFGDASDSSMLLSPAHTYAAPGAYNIQTIIYRSCNANDTISKVVTVSSCSQSSVIAGFTAPDTICINNPVTVTNTSTGASSYFWNFCTGNLNNPPVGTNLGNIGGAMTSPVYIDYVEDNGNYYGFVTDNHTGKLFRLDFGNNLLNTPTMHDFGNFGGQIPIGAEGLQIVKNEGKWYVILVGGDLSFGVTPYIIKVELGTSITNPLPAVTNWGNIGNMAYPHDLYVFSDNGHWYGLTVNYTNNTFTRFDFTNSFSNTPTAVNLGNIGSLNGPTGIHAINDGGRWYAFVTNAISSTLTRLDFGNSLLNVPTGQNLGNIGGLFHTVWDVYVIKYCGELLVYLINADMQHNDLVKLNFNNDITNNAPTGISFGNMAGMSFPHCLSKIFRAGADLYTFVANVNNRSLSRIQFPGCTNASLPNSMLQDPPPFTYNAPGTYNINLTVDDGLPTQTTYCKQVVVLPAPVASPTRGITICDGEQFKIGTGTKSATYLWNTGATTDSIDVTNPGTYWVEVNSFGCKETDTFKITPRLISDFSFKQDVCDPYTIQFTNASTAILAPWWDMGDGAILSGNATPGHTYNAFGDYKVRFSVSDGICRDTVTKIIPVIVLKENIVLTSDTVICAGTTKQLRAVQGLSYCWFPTTYLDNPAAQNPVTNTPQDITYYLHSETIGNNLISNGDFSAGNTGFGSDYTYTTANSTVVGVYAINSNPSAWNSWAASCADHTGGNGNMIMFDGANIPGQKVWYTTISITPNTNFAFSSWIQSIHSTNPARLQFYINGKLLGNIFSASSSTCQWQQFYEVWNSGDATTAEIAIVNQNTFSSGNDFALDDISFAPVFIKRDSVVIKVDKPIVKTNNDTTVCSDKVVPLFTTGAATYTWSPATGLSNPAIANPVATPAAVPTQYIVTGTTTNGCVAKDTILVSAFPKPAITKTQDTLVCRNTTFPLFIGGGVSYAWSSAGQLSGVNSDRPIVSVGISPVTYQVAVTDSYSCVNLDSVQVSVRQYPVFRAMSNQAICAGASQVMYASGGDAYQWSPAQWLSDPSSPSPVATPDATTLFSVYIQESTCAFDTSINMLLTVNPIPVLTVDKANDVNCNTPTAQLRVAGAMHYTWSPATGLDDPNKANPVAAIDTTTQYKVSGVNQFGCSSNAYVEVKATKDGIPRFVVPNSFTPNGDRKNDCFGIQRWGNAIVQEFAVYNRWGQKVFQANSPNQCWDGTFNGKPQDTGGYVYVIRARTLCGEVTTKGIVMLIR